jgi:predicted outer membrane repeat protein
VDHGHVSLRECTVVNNLAALGGAIFAGGRATVEISASILADNVAVRGGGLAILDDAEVEVWTSRLEANQAELEGDQVYACGTLASSPRILLSNALLAGSGGSGLPIANHPRFKAALAVENSSLGRDKLPLTRRG